MAKYCPYIDDKVLYPVCLECDNKICEDTFFCLVVGSRSITDYNYIKLKLDYMLSNYSKVVIVSGGANGVDSLAKRYAKEKDYYYIEFPADWETNGKSAGYIRNKQMHEFISKQNKRGVVAFWDGKSKGTEHNFNLAKKFNNQIKVYTKENN